MDLSRETLGRLAREVAGLTLTDDDLDHVLPYVRAQLAAVARLEALALPEGDPHEYSYAEDRRWLE